MIGGRRRQLPAIRQRMPKQADAKRLAMRMQILNGAAEGDVARLERLFHRRFQPARYIPIVRLGQDMIAASEIDAAIDDRLIRADVEPRALLRRDRLLHIAAQPRMELRLRRHMMRAAPGFERLRGAVRGEQIRVQGLEQRPSLEPVAERVRPSRGGGLCRPTQGDETQSREQRNLCFHVWLLPQCLHIPQLWE